MADPVRVALIGCGEHAASALLPAIDDSVHLTLTSAVDTDSRALRRLANRDIQMFQDATTMATSGTAEAAVIAVPHDMLAETALTCISAGLHVFVEKPLARSQSEGAAVVAAADAQGVVLMPGYCLRFHPSRIQMHDFLARGVTSEVVSLSALKGGPPLNGWLAQPNRGGGQLLFVGSHAVDQLLWLHRTRVTCVSATSVTRLDNGSDETTSILMTFDDDVTATIVVTQASSTHADEIQIVGRTGRLRSDVFAATLNINSTSSRTFDTGATFHQPGNAWQAMFDSELTDFAHAVQHRSSPAVTGLDALRTLAILDAVRDSVAAGTPIPVTDPWLGQEKTQVRRPPAHVRLQFTYPPNKIKSPLVNELVRRFDLQVDIRRADVDAGIGWVQLLLQGDHDEVDAAVEWAEQQGIRVDPVEGGTVSG